jgi:hypothetical protein
MYWLLLQYIRKIRLPFSICCYSALLYCTSLTEHCSVARYSTGSVSQNFVVVDGAEGSVARAAVGVRTGWLVSRGRTAAQLTLLLIFCFSCWLAQF